MTTKKRAMAALAATALLLTLTACTTNPAPVPTQPVPTQPVPTQPTPTQPTPTQPGDQVPPQGLQTVQVTFEGGQVGALVVNGKSPLQQVQIELQRDGKQLVLAKAFPHDGWYRAAFPLNTDWKGSQIVVTEVGDSTKVLGRIDAPAVAALGEYTTTNFHKVFVKPDGKSVQVQGTARAFEAAFKVEIRVGGKVVASKHLMAKEGAPAYGSFQDQLTASVEIPPNGAEAWFIIPSAKDGSEVPELIVPISAGAGGV